MWKKNMSMIFVYIGVIVVSIALKNSLYAKSIRAEAQATNDITLTIFAPSYVAVGQNITYELTAHNKGSQALSNIFIEAEVPKNSTYISGGSFTNSLVEFTLDSLAAGTSKVFTYVVKINENISVGTAIENKNTAHFVNNNENGTRADRTITTVEALGEVVALYENSNGEGFDVARDSFKFENYGNDASRNFNNDLGVADLFSLFGPQVCKSGNTADTCVLSGPAQKWMEAQIKSASGGHCEGMAVTSIRLFDGLGFNGKSTPSDYQSSASDIVDLDFPKDTLENYIMHYFIPQEFKELKDATIIKAPNAILDKLIEDFQKDRPVAYTVGIYQVPDFKLGHAITAYGVEKVTDKEYRILVYDNNFPRQRQYITVDTQANTWRYVTSATPGEPATVYTGTATSENLEITPVGARDLPEGQYFSCPFCQKQQGTIQASGNLSDTSEANTIRFEYVDEGVISVIDAGDQVTGYDFDTETFVNEIPDARVTHYKGGLGKNIPPIIDVTYMDGEEEEETGYAVLIGGETIDSSADGMLMITGEGFAMGLDYIELGPNELLQVNVYPSGIALDFLATETVLAPLLFVSYDPLSDEEPSVIFEVDNVILDTDEYVQLDLEPDSEWVGLYDSGGLGQEFDLAMILIWPDGVEEVFTQTVNMPKGTHDALIDFGAWDGLLDPPLYIDEIIQNPSINHRLNVTSKVNTFDRTSQTNAPAGVVSITATYQNNSEVSLEDIYFDVAELSGENILLNEEIQASAIISVPAALLGDDGVLGPLESFTYIFEVGIASQSPFQFSVNANGTPIEWLPGEQPLPVSDEINENSFDLDVGASVFNQDAPTAMAESEEPGLYYAYLPLIYEEIDRK